MRPETQELFEMLAAIEHERWSDWQRWVHGQCVSMPISVEGDDSVTVHVIPNDLWDRWERQIETPYDQLSEKEKDSDRQQVERYWPLIEPLETELEEFAASPPSVNNFAPSNRWDVISTATSGFVDTWNDLSPDARREAQEFILSLYVAALERGT